MLPRISGLILVTLFAVVLGAAQNPEPSPPPTGTWKVLLPLLGDAKQASWLIRFEKKDAWQGSIVAAAEGVPQATVEGVQVIGATLRFTLKTSSHTLAAQVPVAESRMMGEVSVGGKSSPIVLEATRMTALDDYALAEELLTRPENTRETFRAAMTLLALSGSRKATLEQIETWAKRAAVVAEGMGDERRDALLTLATYLTQQPSTAALAVGYAQQAEKLVSDQDAPIVRKRILRVLALALERAGKEDEAKAVQARNEAIELLRLQTYNGKAKSVVLVENFTCVQQGKCLATDLACEGLERTYRGGDVLVLCEHVSVPGPDPLSNPATLERQRFYQTPSAPAVFFNGKPAPGAGGSIEEAQSRYEAYVATLNALLSRPTRGTPTVAPAVGQPAVVVPPVLNLKVNQTGETLDVEVKVAEVVNPEATFRLRVALVEEVVGYTGANGLPRHRNVVRDYLGGAAGLALLEKVGQRSFQVDLAELRKKMQADLEKTHAVTPFPARNWPTDLKNLRVVAFIQNDSTRDILAAVATGVSPRE